MHPYVLHVLCVMQVGQWISELKWLDKLKFHLFISKHTNNNYYDIKYCLLYIYSIVLKIIIIFYKLASYKIYAVINSHFTIMNYWYVSVTWRPILTWKNLLNSLFFSPYDRCTVATLSTLFFPILPVWDCTMVPRSWRSWTSFGDIIKLGVCELL